MAKQEFFRVVYRIVGGQEVDADVYLPRPKQGDGTSPFPVIINIHGGAFMLGSSKMVNQDQVKDCLDRGWIVVAPNHRLCPQVDLLEGPIGDCRACLAWIHDGGLGDAISQEATATYRLDLDHVFAFGTSSGGTLALCLGFDVPRPVAGIYDMYGPCDFANPFWRSELPDVMAMLPPELSDEFMNQVYLDDPVPIKGGVSLEGQQPGRPDFSDYRQAFAWSRIARGRVLETVCPKGEWDRVDSLRNIGSVFPPTFIVHGTEDKMVPMDLSQKLYAALRSMGIQCGMVEVPGEGHTFAARMEVGSQTWRLQRKGFDFLENLL
ncbi:Alpha/Beta hydrolase protein [Podospora aff. communis PSN243]|uniref:Alpha/Beta hydrolase protein n=1 Tax=Podospora aff. communis PSN243 TaxID=3040156 RepID=A0AAV9GFD8_9PEZI|nr:Alpha/Beta hydrolase protein [Podospora aff. communis PSN243]